MISLFPITSSDQDNSMFDSTRDFQVRQERQSLRFPPQFFFFSVSWHPRVTTASSVDPVVPSYAQPVWMMLTDTFGVWVITHRPNQSPVTYVSHPMPVIITPSPLINPTSSQQLLNITLEDIIHPAITLLLIFHQNQVYLKVWWRKNGKRKKTHKIHKSQYFMIL